MPLHRLSGRLWGDSAGAFNGVDKVLEALHGEGQGLLRHVGEANPEPTRIGAMAGRARRDVQPNFVDDFLPQFDLTLECVCG